jgi:hypothetical protein
MQDTLRVLGKIWCLFSVENHYDQPANNLVAAWADNPSIDALFTAQSGTS